MGIARESRVSSAMLLAVFMKATMLSFSGFGSLPVLREELVVNRQVLTDDDLNRAVAVARMTPGPMGSYVVAVGYAAGGVRGAALGWIAMAAPALVVIPILTFVQRRVKSLRWETAIEAVILASAALVFATAISLISTAVYDIGTAAAASVALALVFLTDVPVIWALAAGAAVTGLGGLLL